MSVSVRNIKPLTPLHFLLVKTGLQGVLHDQFESAGGVVELPDGRQ